MSYLRTEAIVWHSPRGKIYRIVWIQKEVWFKAQDLCQEIRNRVRYNDNIIIMETTTY